MYGWYYVYNPKWGTLGASVQDNDYDQVYIVNTAKTYSNNAITAMAGIGLETGTSALFITHYVAGYYQAGNYHSGMMWQNGTHYWADQSKTWTYMSSYYWSYSSSTGNQPVVSFTY